MDASVQTLEERIMIVSSIDVDGSVEEDVLKVAVEWIVLQMLHVGTLFCSPEYRTPVLPSAVVHTVTFLPLSNAHFAPL